MVFPAVDAARLTRMQASAIETSERSGHRGQFVAALNFERTYSTN